MTDIYQSSTDSLPQAIMRSFSTLKGTPYEVIHSSRARASSLADLPCSRSGRNSEPFSPAG
jgi:hypothetical protein